MAQTPPQLDETLWDLLEAAAVATLPGLKTNERLLEEITSFPLKLGPPDSCLIENVKILGNLSINRRRYTAEAVNNAINLYEGCKVNINHPAVPNTNRSLYDRFGTLQNVKAVGDELYGNLRYNPKHPLAETVKWWAENDPNMLGLSHNAVGQGKDENGVFVVDKIVTVRSVDLVADPATTKGLYEERTMPADTAPAQSATVEPASKPAGIAAGKMDTEGMVSKEDRNYKLGCMVADLISDTKLDKKTKAKKLLAATDLIDEGDMPESVHLKPAVPAPAVADAATPAATPPAKTARELAEEVLQKTKANTAAKKAEADKIKAENDVAARRVHALALCEEAKLPKDLVSELFIEQLVASKDETRTKALIEERNKLWGGPARQPRAQGQPAQPVELTRDQFLTELKKG